MLKTDMTNCLEGGGVSFYSAFKYGSFDKQSNLYQKMWIVYDFINFNSSLDSVFVHVTWTSSAAPKTGLNPKTGFGPGCCGPLSNFGNFLKNDFWTHPPPISILYMTIFIFQKISIHI